MPTIRSAVHDLLQLGMEVTEGTSVVATKRLPQTNVEFGTAITYAQVQAMGYLYPASSNPGRRWGTFRVPGSPLNFNEIVYPLNSVLKKVTAAPGGATSKVHTFDPSVTATDAYQTFTGERGSSVRASKMVGMRFTDFGINTGVGTATWTGAGIGQIPVQGITMTALTSAAEVPMVPALETEVSIFQDTTGAGLGTTQLLLPTTFNWSITGKALPVRALNATIPGYSGTSDAAPRTTVSITLQDDATADVIRQNGYNGVTMFFEQRVTGPLIETSHNYSIKSQLACQVTGPETYSVVDGADMVTFPMGLVYDPTWGFALKVIVENLVASL